MGFGRLTWGVKQSFRGYVEMSGGTTTAGGGAARDAEGAFEFQALPEGDLAVGADGRLAGATRFAGEVAFEAHGGMLRVVLGDPAVEATEAGVVLTCADSTGRRVEVAKLEAATAEADGTLVLPAKITLDGMMLLGDHYPPGTPLDPVRLTPV